MTALDGDAKFTINQKEVTYTSTGADKVYDSKQDAPADLGGSFAAGDIVVASGLGINDTGKLSVTGGRYGDKNVGTAKTVTQFVLDGDSKDNYSLASGSSVAGDISKLATTLTLSADARVYDGSSDIAAVRTAFSPAIFSGDTVTVDTSGAAYGDANVGASKTITGVADAQISGADKGNYEITIAGTRGDAASAARHREQHRHRAPRHHRARRPQFADHSERHGERRPGQPGHRGHGAVRPHRAPAWRAPRRLSLRR